MKTNTRKNVGAAVLLLGGLAGASSAQAVIVNGLLGVLPSATDVYTFSCPAGTNHASGRVQDLGPVVAPLVSLQIVKTYPSPIGATNVTDPVDGDAFASPYHSLAKGPGQYILLVDKTGYGSEAYRVVAECFNNNGIVISQGIVMPHQNQ